MKIGSIHEECLKEEASFKWIESEKAGMDLGDTATRRWVQIHWWGYLSPVAGASSREMLLDRTGPW